MLNYIKSELYRSRHNWFLIGMTAICWVLLAAVVLILLCYVKEPDFPYANTRFALSNIYAQMGIIYILTAGFAYAYLGNEEKDHTIKHSIAYGFHRNTVYFGRLITTELLAIGIYIFLCASFAGLAYALLPHSNSGEFMQMAKISFYTLPCLMFGVAVTHTFLLMMNAGTGFFLAASVIYIIPVILNIIGRKVEFIYHINYFLPFNLVDMKSEPLSIPGKEWKSFVIGLVWLIVTVVVGSFMYNKKEVK